MISSDAHLPDELDNQFEHMAKKLRSLRLNEIVIYRNGRCINESLAFTNGSSTQ